MTTYTIAKNVKQLDAQIETAIQSANTMKAAVQQAAVSIIFHAFTHGDYTRAQTLVDGLGNGINSKAIVEWFVQFGGLTIDEENKCFGGWKGKDYIKANIETAKSTMWYDLKVQAPFKGFDLNDEIAKLLKKATAMAAEVEKGSEKAASIKCDLKTLAALTTLSTAPAIAAKAH